MNKSNSKIIKDIIRYDGHDVQSVKDHIASEEPIEISISLPNADPAILNKNISITMRTPGQDEALAIGFLYSEGIINYEHNIITHLPKENKITVELPQLKDIDLKKLERHFYTTSSCGVCGKSSIESIWHQCPIETPSAPITVHSDIIRDIPDTLLKHQDTFNQTGGLHAAALFNIEGNIIDIKEDVGRHNALDKIIGSAILRKELPLNNQIILLSGRISFELVQKAVMAGIRIILAIGAPSSLAIQLAEEFDITLIGFLKSSRFNIYHGEQRIVF